MKQRKKSILILFCSLCIVSILTLAQQRETPPVRLERIADGLYQILEGQGANGGVYIGEDGVLVIDSKMTKESVNQTIEKIKKITVQPIKYLVNTHSDPDHVAGNQFFPESVMIIAHENCRKEFFYPLRDGKASSWNNPELAPFLPSLTYRDKMDIYLGSKKVELWYFGIGHTQGDTIVYFPEEKIAFLGDQIFMDRPQVIHSIKGGNSFGYVNALTQMLGTLEAEKFCSGHSDPVDRDTVKHHIEEMKKIQGKIRSLVEQGKNLEDVKKEFDDNHASLVESIFNEIKKELRLE